MAIRIFSCPVLPTSADRLAGNHVRFDCDTTAELPSENVIDGDTAFTVDTGTNYKRVSGSWVSQIGAATYNARYITILQAAGSHIAGRVAGTYAMGNGDPLAISGTGTLYTPAVIAINSADYPTINGLAPKLRIRGQIACNDVAPTGNFTFGLHPITRPSTSGGAGLNIYTIGAAVSGSNGATVSAPAADSHSNLVGADFALPANGLYVIGVVTTATVATASHLHFNAQLQIRNA